MEVLHAKNVEGAKNEWDASPESIKATAEWLFPILERFIRGVNGMANGYVIEGVDFLRHKSQNYPRAIKSTLFFSVVLK